MSFLRYASPALLLIALLAPRAGAQTIQSFILAMNAQRDAQGRIVGTAQVQVPPRPLKVVAATAFSATETREFERLLPDGSRRTETPQPHRVFRDSFGRTRIERPLVEGAADSTMLVEINDPGAGLYYLLDPVNQVAHSVKYTPPRLRLEPEMAPLRPTVRTSLITPGGPAGGAVPLTERLGTRTILGVEAEGRRTSVTMAVNPAVTTEVFSRVTETWYSPELEITLLTTVTDPRAGGSRFEVTDLVREPQPDALFAPPAGYRVVEQQPFFSVEFK